MLQRDSLPYSQPDAKYGGENDYHTNQEAAPPPKPVAASERQCSQSRNVFLLRKNEDPPFDKILTGNSNFVSRRHNVPSRSGIPRMQLVRVASRTDVRSGTLRRKNDPMPMKAPL